MKQLVRPVFDRHRLVQLIDLVSNIYLVGSDNHARDIPPFNMKSRGEEDLCEDKRQKYDVPSVRNANFTWDQHMIHHLAPTGLAGFVLAHGSMSSPKSRLACGFWRGARKMVTSVTARCSSSTPVRRALWREAPTGY